jgi:hypothetical protein
MECPIGPAPGGDASGTDRGLIRRFLDTKQCTDYRAHLRCIAEVHCASVAGPAAGASEFR